MNLPELSAAELRVVANTVAAASGAIEQSGEPTDAYRVAASKMFGVPYERVTAAQRSAAKAAAYRSWYS